MTSHPASWTVEQREVIDLDEVREVRIRLIGGDVAVTAAAGPAHLEVERVHGEPVVVRYEEGTLTVSYDLDWERWDRWVPLRRQEALVALTVPPNTSIDLGLVSASTAVRGVEGPVRAKTVSGDVTLDDLGGDVDVRTVSGDVDGRSVRGRLAANSVSGDLIVAEARCPEVRAKAVSGDVTLDLAVDPPGRYEVNTLSGDVALRFDREPDLVVSVTTMSGRIDSAFPIDSERGPVGRRVSGRLGDGKGELRVKTMSGRVALVGPVRA
jgi:hypothetical protein